MTTRIVTDANGRKHITNEPLLHPPQRTWVNATTWRGLTDEEITEEMPVTGHRPITSFAKAIEAKLKEKNK